MGPHMDSRWQYLVLEPLQRCGGGKVERVTRLSKVRYSEAANILHFFEYLLAPPVQTSSIAPCCHGTASTVLQLEKPLIVFRADRVLETRERRR